MILTTRQIQDAPLVLNPERKLTLVLRNLRLSDITNIAAASTKYQVLDLSGNELVTLARLPPDSVAQLEVLLLANNNITYVEEEFRNPGSLRSISLMNNNIHRFQPSFIRSFEKIESLVLVGNPITKLRDYRLFMIWLAPSLRALDLQKVSRSERQAASRKFGEERVLASGAVQEMFKLDIEPKSTEKSVALSSSDKQAHAVVNKLSETDKQQLLRKLENASSIEEIEQIENMIRSGRV
ncbi:uncharacterized protein LODBEIA_P40250 [Lodderomyces beijingensis]|uniref:U2 small nuclear ribonucleoprotein A' n=1 Tax=Lodderomyces beijingensis TaxID=1775926 RepID=A0ABP0ZRT7_9ASCO